MFYQADSGVLFTGDTYSATIDPSSDSPTSTTSSSLSSPSTYTSASACTLSS